MSKIKYGLYYYNTENIGDEIQSIAARRFLPKVDYYIDRDNINATKIPKDEAVKLIMNGWYTHKPENWPPKSKNLKPLLMSMHINPYSETTLNKFKTTESLNFLKNHSPVGARDLTTLNYLGSIGIETYFSGCLTLTLKADRNIKRKNRILAVDVSDEIYETMKKHTDTEIIRLDTFRLQNMSISEKMALAEYYLYLYQSAKAVVTSRLHCMLPCLALETPVLTIIKKEPERYAGLIELSHHMTEQEYLKNANSYDLHTPPQNPSLYKKYRKTLCETCKNFTGFDSQKSFLDGKKLDDLLQNDALTNALGKSISAGFDLIRANEAISAKNQVISEKDQEMDTLRWQIEELRNRVNELENLGVKATSKNLLKASSRYLQKLKPQKKQNRFKITNLVTNGQKIIYDYEIEGTENFKKIFWLGEKFSVEFLNNDYDLAQVPKSILAIPLISNILPIIWINNATIEVEELNQDFYNCLKNVKKEYLKMLPRNIQLKGNIKVKKLIKNTYPSKQKHSTLTFSGGVDSYATMLTYLKDKPDIVTVWGADIDFENETGWKQVEKQVLAVGKEYGLRNILIKSPIRRFIDNSELEKQYHNILHDNWWHAMQHGIGFIGLMAPYAYLDNVEKIFIPSTFKRDENILCASNAGIMEVFKFGETHCVYDDSLGSRQEKVNFIVNSNQKVKLRVCYRSHEGVNCCNCEKCFRTIMQILVNQKDPNLYGFNISDTQLRNIPKRLREVGMDFNDNAFWRQIQQEFLKNHAFWKDDKRINWVFDLEFKD